MKSRLDDASACRRIADSRSRDQRRSQTALCLLKKTKDMHRAHGAPDSQRDEPVEEDAEFHNFITLATMESLDVDKFNHHLTHMFLYDTKERIRAFTDAPKVLYITMEDYFRAATNHPPVTPEQDSQRDQFGNSKEDLITCAIIESLDVGTFTCIVQCTTKNELLDITGRIDAFGDSPGVLYSSMKKHFAQRARAAQNAAEAGARAGSGAAKAATPAETLELARRRVEAIEAKIRKPESEGLLVDSGGAHARPAKKKARDKITGGAKTKQNAPRYLGDPNSMSACKPSDALRSKLRTILEVLLKQDPEFYKRDLDQMISQDDDEDNKDLKYKPTAATEYREWNASKKHKAAFGAFLMELVESINPTPGDGARGNTTISDSEEQPNRPRRRIASDSSDDDA